MLSSHFLVVVLFFLSFSLCVSQPLPLPALPYAYSALEPLVSERLLRVHHLKHHQTYTDRTNTILASLRAHPSLKSLAKLGVDSLLLERHVSQLPADIKQDFLNQAGGYINHELFFRTLKAPVPLSSVAEFADSFPEPASAIAAAIDKQFGSFEAFKALMTATAANVFGSGWAFLYLDVHGDLTVGAFFNQDTPAAVEGQKALLAVDAWEHAYHMQYESARKDWIAAWWKLINWAEVDRMFVEAKAVPKSAEEQQGSEGEEL